MNALGLNEVVMHCEHGESRRVRTPTGWRGGCEACIRLRAENVEKAEAEFQARMREQELAQLYRNADVPRRFFEKGLGDYQPRTAGQRKALAACASYAKAIEQRIRSGSCLVLVGPPGVGKSHLLVGVLHAALQAMLRAKYTTMVGFLAAVKGSWAWHGAECGQPFLTPRLLVLDELWIPGAARDRETLLALLDERYRDGRPTLLASNLSWPQMHQELGERFCDRLLEGGGQVVPVDGKSARETSRPLC